MKIRLGRFRFLGPVLLYDLICLARRPRYLVLRALFPVALLVILYLAYRGISQSGPTWGRPAKVPDMADLAGIFFTWFMGSQFALALLLTPAYTAGCIAEEKDRRRVDFLFATDLEDQEIVLGKLIARVANLLVLLMAGLPVLAFVQFWGGVDPELVLVGYAAIGLTVVSIAAFSIYQSVRARKARDAIVTSYFFLFAYFGFSYLAVALVRTKTIPLFQILFGSGWNPLSSLVRAIASGNILFVQSELREALIAGKKISVVLPGIFLRYASFHLLLALTFTAAAVAQVRRRSLTEALPRSKRSKRRSEPEYWLGMGDDPMMWKELCIDPGLSFNRYGKALVGLIVLGSFLPAVWNLGWVFWQAWYPSPNQVFYANSWLNTLGLAINDWVRQVGIAVACLTILGAAVRAASSVSGEHEQQTLDSLLASPLRISSILLAKWVSSIWSVRVGVLWLCLVWTIGIVMGGLNLVTLPWLVLCWFVYAVFFSALGLWFSVRTNKTLTATVWTLVCTVVLSVGQVFPWLLIGMPGMYASTGLRTIANFQTFGMSPPLAIGWLSFRGIELSFFTARWDSNPFEILLSIMWALIVWIVGAGFLWKRAWRRLSRERINAAGNPTPRPREALICSPIQSATILPITSDYPW